MNANRWLIPLAILLTVGCGHTARTRADFTPFAGAPIKSFRYASLYNWQRAGDFDLVLWTKPSEAYLLDLVDHCQPQDNRYSIDVGGLAGVPGRVSVGDDVNFGPLRCRILSIRPIDLARMKQK